MPTLKNNFTLSALAFMFGVFMSCGKATTAHGIKKEKGLVSTAPDTLTKGKTGANENFKGSRTITKKYDLVTYHVHLLKGSEYYKRTNRSISTKALRAFSQESVAIVEFENINKSKPIWESPVLLYDKIKAEQYLMGAITDDIFALSDEETVMPAGVLYESGMGATNRIRIFVFLGNIPPEKIDQLVLYDQLFGAGMIRFNFKQSTNS